MLTALSIRNIVLIESLDLDFRDGLTVMTGETGAGKSILLDCLGLIFGRRAEQGLVRKNAEKGSITATLSLADLPHIKAFLHENDIDCGDEMVLRRTLHADGKSKAFINDEAVSVGLLKSLGEHIIEIHGQFDTHGLLNPSTHRHLLDEYAGHDEFVRHVATAYKAWREAEQAFINARDNAQQAGLDADYLRHALDEIDTLAPQQGEEEELDSARQLLMNQEKIVSAIQRTEMILSDEEGAESLLKKALFEIETIAAKASGTLDPLVSALNSAVAETENALYELQAAQNRLEGGHGNLAEIEDRLFALRDVARKHQCTVDDLPQIREKIATRLDAIDNRDSHLEALEQAAQTHKKSFMSNAQKLSDSRTKSAATLTEKVMKELPALKMERTNFQVFITRIEDEKRWNGGGMDDVVFLVSTNHGAAPGPLNKIASGGEMARLMLAIKVALSEVNRVPVMIFDEVDTGVGGATAAAIGDRLRLVANNAQILLVTHSPQVAAKGHHHWMVSKHVEGEHTLTRVAELEREKRREELARMLAGSTITDEARAAADSLLLQQNEALRKLA